MRDVWNNVFIFFFHSSEYYSNDWFWTISLLYVKIELNSFAVTSSKLKHIASFLHTFSTPQIYILCDALKIFDNSFFIILTPCFARAIKDSIIIQINFW